MRYIADAGQMKEIDRRTSQEIGIPPIVLMEKAAERIARQAGRMLCKKKMPAGRDVFDGEEVLKWGKFPDNGNALGKKRVLAVYGAGGNGGDAAAAARLLKLKGASVCLLPADDRLPGELTGQELAIAEKCGVEICRGVQTGKDIDFSAYDIILDGIFGIGLSREIGEPYRTLIERINASGTPVLAIDIPSGIHAGTGECLGTAVKAACTVTFGEYKVGQLLYPGALYCGEILLADAGFVPELSKQVLTKGKYRYLTYDSSDLPGLLPERVPRSHKGSYGKVLVYAGSAKVTGAAYLAAKAAYRCGVGLVKLVSAAACVDTVRGILPEALYETIAEGENTAEKKEFFSKCVQWADAVLAGPGIGTEESAAQNLNLLLGAVKEQKKPLVLDADALNILAAEESGREENRKIPAKQQADSKKDENIPPAGNFLPEAKTARMRTRLARLSEKLPEYAILTPHPKELSRLTGLSVGEITEHLIDTAKQCIYNNKLIYVLKDAHTIVACGEEIYINRSGCDGMATGGSGDVLAGILAGLCAGKEPFEAARAGVFLHGLCGEEAQRKCGSRAMLAGDILDGMLALKD